MQTGLGVQRGTALHGMHGMHVLSLLCRLSMPLPYMHFPSILYEPYTAAAGLAIAAEQPLATFADVDACCC